MSFTDPTIEDFKLYFTRDFTYGAVPTTVMDADLTKALNRADATIAEGCFANQADYEIGFFYLMAHYLVKSLNSATQGASGKATWMRTSHSVGPVSESFAIPDVMINDPLFNSIAETNYGKEYLMMIYPKMVGQVFTVEGCSRP